ncbi:hypothetical protein [Saccharopolyspora pogona]|uniref:hypothetical protein n=1 Tax=Saccharopolyspora pogona TaxID=333966 RepID=UPI001689141F|nr:hypothetical protein [Saccharopolyspora pogona]
MIFAKLRRRRSAGEGAAARNDQADTFLPPTPLDSGLRKWQGPGFDGDLRVACHATATLCREDYSVNWQATLAKGIAVVGPTISIELGVLAVLEQ